MKDLLQGVETVFVDTYFAIVCFLGDCVIENCIIFYHEFLLLLTIQGIPYHGLSHVYYASVCLISLGQPGKEDIFLVFDFPLHYF